MNTKGLYLGVDIGTSKIATVLYSPPNTVLEVRSEFHNAHLPTTPGRSEEAPDKMLALCTKLIQSIPSEMRQKITAVGVTGQMHGIFFINLALSPVTALVTWQDKRCSEIPGFLESISKKTGYKLCDGYGFATLLWSLHTNTLPSNACFCTTVQDLLITRLIGAKKPIIDTSTAASWGFFDATKKSWDYSAITTAGIDKNMLPNVLSCGDIAGVVSPEAAQLLGLPADIPVMTAIGDNQASLLGTIKHYETDIALTLGTGGQVSVVVDSPFPYPPVPTFENRPFVGKKTALVAAALCGGNAWEWLAKFVQNIISSMGTELIPLERIYEKMNSEGLKSKEELAVKANFHGERHDETLKGAIEGITLENTTLGSLARGLARGIIRNLKNMLPKDSLKNREKVVGSGGALRKTLLLQRMVEEEFGLPLEILEATEEAAVGAAINAYNGLHKQI